MRAESQTTKRGRGRPKGSKNERTIGMEKAIADACAVLYGGKEDTWLEDFLRDLSRKQPSQPSLTPEWAAWCAADQTAATHSASPDGPKARKTLPSTIGSIRASSWPARCLGSEDIRQ
jgi:hypothetical protein